MKEVRRAPLLVRLEESAMKGVRRAPLLVRLEESAMKGVRRAPLLVRLEESAMLKGLEQPGPDRPKLGSDQPSGLKIGGVQGMSLLLRGANV
jgi:hypothetical protein